METDNQYKIDLEICPTPILLVASNGEVIRTNQRMCDLFGYDREELVGQSIEILVPPDVRDYHPDLRTAFFEVPTSRRMGTGRDLHGVRKDGTMIPVEIGLDPIEFHGDLMVMVSVLDIRERKNNEAMIRRALNAASSAMIQVDDTGAIELVNERAGELFGYEINEMLGKPIEMLVPERFRRKHTVYRTSYLNNRDKREMGSGRDLFGVRKNGTEFPVEIGLTPVHEVDGRSTMATIIDISDRKSKERYIAEKNQQLQKLNQELVQFAYSASHDLKAPLASITGLLDYAATDLEAGDVDEVRTNLQKSRGLANRLAKRIEDMLQLAKSDMVADEWAEIEVEDRISAVWSALDTRNVKLTTDYQHESPLRTIAVRFDTIVENLLSNAVKYRNRNQKDSSVTVKTWSDPEGFGLAVEDNGIGIPSKHRDKVFNLFQRVSDTNEPGSGLGLAITKKNVSYLGGTIDFVSDNGKTAFTIVLPQTLSNGQEEGGTV